jgi:hypothetical protein
MANERYGEGFGQSPVFKMEDCLLSAAQNYPYQDKINVGHTTVKKIRLSGTIIEQGVPIERMGTCRQQFDCQL